MSHHLFSENDTNKSSGALIDDPLKGLSEFVPGIVRHPFELGVQILTDQIVEGFSENIGLPDPGGKMCIRDRQ